MAGSTVDAGERVPCPACGATVLLKAMIPVLADPATGAITYLCPACARQAAGLPPGPAAAAPAAPAAPAET
jgi:hypothetical protein